MRVPFSRQLATRLFTLPLLLLLLLIVLGGIGVYYLTPLHFISDTHRRYLTSLSADKKLLFDTWFEQTTRAVDLLSRSGRLDDAAVSAGQHRKGPAEGQGRALSSKTARALEGLFSSAPFKVVALLSKEGKVLASSQRELEGGDWSDREFFEQATPDLKAAAAVGLYNYGSSDSGIVFLAPVVDADGDTVAFLYCLAGIDRAARLLQRESPLYSTERVELIDREGNVLLTKSGAPDRKVRYNLPRAAEGGQVRHRDRYFYSVVSLDHAPFRLISTVERSEVLLPVTILLAFLSVAAAALLVLTLAQGLSAAPRRITRPIAKLIGMTKLVAAGSLDIEVGQEYRGELLELKKAFERMIEELKAREASVRTIARAGGAAGEIGAGPMWYPGSISHEVRAPLQRMVGEAEQVLAAERGLSEPGRRMLADLRDTGAELIGLLDSLLDFLKLEAGGSAVAPEACAFCDLLAEVEEHTRRLIGYKEITLIVDCHEALTGATVSVDRARLRHILFLLAGTAAGTTEVGTITILSSTGIKEGVSFIEVSIADTGRGIHQEALERLADDAALSLAPLGIVIAKKTAELLGGRVEIESEAGKGTVVTVTVPTQAIIF